MSVPTAEQLTSILNCRKFDPQKEPHPEQVIFKIGEKRVGSLQNLVTITGKQKNGKTRYVAAAIAAGLTGKNVFQIQLRTPAHRHKIALFDTEQGEYDFYKLVKQIHEFTGLQSLSPNFDAYNTREDDPITILRIVDHYLKNNPDCAVLVIDGILDLLIDFNNVAESKRLTNYFKKITKKYNVLVIGVIHRGKGSDTTIGNIGSMADRLAQSVLKVEKNKERNTFCLSSDFMRSDEDFSPVEIWKVGETWEETFHIEEQPAAAPVRQLKAAPAEIDRLRHIISVNEIFEDSSILLNYEDLIKNIKEIYSVGRNWAVDCIKHLKNEQLIFRTNEGYTNTKQKTLKFK